MRYVLGTRFPLRSLTGQKRTWWPQPPPECSCVLVVSSLPSPSTFSANVPLGLNDPPATAPELSASGKNDWALSPSVVNRTFREVEPLGYHLKTAVFPSVCHAAN